MGNESSTLEFEPSLQEQNDIFESLSPIKRTAIISTFLAHVPILARVNHEYRQQLAESFTRHVYHRDECVVRQGDMGDQFFIIRRGEVSVSMMNEESKMDERVAVLKDGDYFGETSLLTNAPRNATITAISDDVECLVLGKADFDRIFANGNGLRVNFAKRGAISADNSLLNSRKKRRSSRLNTTKSDSTRRLIADAVENNVLFAALDEEQIERIVDVMWSLNIEKGTDLIRQGEPGDNFYVLESGIVDIFIIKDGERKHVATRHAGESFGELALMYNSPRSATVTCRSNVKVWAVERYMFRKILVRISEAKLAEYERFLRSVPILDSLLANERRAVAEALDERKFHANDVIIKQGTKGDTFYIIRKGQAVVHKRSIDASPTDIGREVCRLSAGGFFGERALIKNDVRAATVTATTTMECLCLDREAFDLLLGPLNELLNRKINEDYDGILDVRGEMKDGNERRPSARTPIDIGSPRAKGEKKIRKADLTSIGVLGKGSFGVVELVQDCVSAKTFALKQVSKAQIVNTGQQEHIVSEKRVMSMLVSNRFCVRLFETYNDAKYLYFLCEVILGGELFSVLRARTVFDDRTSRFYAACVIEAFDYMHNFDIVYRDLKPENLLLTENGYLKITDFGFAKIVPDRTYTLCGTPDYLAPEVISGSGHGKGVDWWTLGVLIYEMLASYPPFYDEDPMKTYAKIMYGKVKYPKHFRRSAVDLIRRLLSGKPTKRLGCIHGGTAMIRKSSWFDGFDWEALNNGSVEAPIIPSISNATDTSNFDVYDDDEDFSAIADTYVDDGSGWDRDF